MNADASDIAGPENLTDEELAAQAVREGSDGAAFSAMERYREKVWRVCWRLMGAEHDAEDAAQEVFVRLFFERGKFAGRSTYSTWLHGVAIRTCLMLRRSRSRRRRREDATDDERMQAQPDAKPEAAAAIDASHDIRKLLEGLDEEDRACAHAVRGKPRLRRARRDVRHDVRRLPDADQPHPGEARGEGRPALRGNER